MAGSGRSADEVVINNLHGFVAEPVMGERQRLDGINRDLTNTRRRHCAGSDPTGGPLRAPFRRSAPAANTYPVSGTTIQLSGDDWGNPNVADSEVFVIASRKPTEVERAKLYGWMSARTGLVAW